jgi:hypothetical protein
VSALMFRWTGLSRVGKSAGGNRDVHSPRTHREHLQWEVPTDVVRVVLKPLQLDATEVLH